MNGRHRSRGHLSRAGQPVLASLALALLAGCTTLGGNVSGDFACRAPQGNCAPASVIDARAIANLADETDHPATAPRQHGNVRAEPGDLSRTSERKLRIVFPAHIDAAGIFHEEAVAWAIAEPADWAARARAPEAPQRLRAIGKLIADRLEAAQTDSSNPDELIPQSYDTSSHDDILLPLASPPPLDLAFKTKLARALAEPFARAIGVGAGVVIVGREVVRGASRRADQGYRQHDLSASRPS